MSLSLYMDHHVASAITRGLRARGVDVLTAYEDGSDRLLDAELLDRAGQLGKLLFTQDQDLLSETAQRQQTGQFFGGVVYAHQVRVGIGACIRDLELIAKTSDQEELFNQVVHLPLK